jgi:exonuclease III
MIYASWNIRGIQAEGRKTAITNTFSRIRPNIIGFQETKKEIVPDSYRKSLVANRLFAWASLPAKGSAGGILVGVDLDMFDLISHEIKEIFVSVIVRHKALDVVIRFINFYGSSYEEEKDLFISELRTLFSTFQGHTIIGGDFNLVRF